jgi:hypothetical protein
VLTLILGLLTLGDFLDIGGSAKRHAVGTNTTTTLAALGVHLMVMLDATVGVMLGVPVNMTPTSATVMPMLTLFAFAVDTTTAFLLFGFLRGVLFATSIPDRLDATACSLCFVSCATHIRIPSIDPDPWVRL